MDHYKHKGGMHKMASGKMMANKDMKKNMKDREMMMTMRAYKAKKK